jgi:hypothetical protein
VFSWSFGVHDSLASLGETTHERVVVTQPGCSRRSRQAAPQSPTQYTEHRTQSTVHAVTPFWSLLFAAREVDTHRKAVLHILKRFGRPGLPPETPCGATLVQARPVSKITDSSSPTPVHFITPSLSIFIRDIGCQSPLRPAYCKYSISHCR